MAGQTYQVNYIVNVDATTASNAINAFKRTLMSMDKATKPLVDLQAKTRGLIETLGVLANKPYTVKVDTRPATQKIGKLVRSLQMVRGELERINAMGIYLGGATVKGKGSKRAAARGGGSSAAPAVAPAPAAPSRSRTSTRAAATRTTRTAPRSIFPSAANTTNLGYKLWGPTPLPNNGGMAIDMLKGMGIAYGIAGMGTLISNVVDQAVEYDNVMKTVENILKSHDTDEDFTGRFANMSAVIRNVGMETKFKVTEVADAAKFLAMAGFDVESIKQSIRPIADIALVGDTDLGQTADLVTNIMTAYNIAPQKMRNAADVMTNTFTMSNTTLTEIAEAYKYAASLLSAGDVPFEEATSAIGVLGDAGIKGSQAGTTLRTIMANIVNPTKKQQKAWDAIGISRFKSDGSRKGLLEIFKELNNANLDVASYYQLFHKTAASGAVALSSHVGKWEDVYLENYLSKGLSSSLADEKKNTLQGLWAQLTSVFTDKGVTAFSGIQGQLRNLMSSAIDWLKSDQATAAFKRVSDTMMEFVHVMIDASKWFVWFFDKFGGVIKAWAKFQLMIWPVVKGVTAFRSIMLALLGIKKVGYMITGIANSFQLLGRSASIAGTRAAKAMGGLTATTVAPGVVRYNGPISWAPGFSSNTMDALRRGSFQIGGKTIWKFGAPVSSIPRPHYDAALSAEENAAALANYKKRYGGKMGKRMALNQVGSMAGNLVGSAAMMYGLSKVADADNGWDTASGALFGVAGAAAMMGGPIGWGVAGVAAALGGLAALRSSWVESKKIYGEMQDFAQQNVIKNGTIANSENTIMQYLEQQYTKHKDINDLVEKRIELTAQLLGLQTGENPMEASTGVFKELMDKTDDMWSGKQLDSFNSIYQDKFGSNLHLVNFGGAYYLTTADNVKGSYVSNGKGGSVYTVTGENGEEVIRAGNGTTNGLKAAWASAAATAELMAPGGYYEKLVANMRMNVAKMGYRGASTAEFNDYINSIIHSNAPQYLQNLVSLSDIKDTDWDMARMLLDEQTRKYMWTQLQAILEPMQEAFTSFRNEVDSNTLTASTLANYLRFVIGDQPGLNMKDYDPNNIAEWYSHYGFKDGTFTWLDIKDEKTGETKHYDAQQAAQMAASNMQSVIDAVQKSGAAAEPAGAALIGFCQTLLTQAQAFMGASDELIDVAQNQEITLNGQLYRWNELSQLYEAIDENGNLVMLQTQMTGLGNSIMGLSGALGQDWNSTFSGLTNNLFNLGNLALGWPRWGSYLPSPSYTGDGGVTGGVGATGGIGITPLSGDFNFGTTPVFSLGQNNSWLNTRTNPLTAAFNRSMNNMKPNTLSLQGASNIVSLGGGHVKGWKGRNFNTGDNDDIDHNGTGNGHGTNTSDYKSHQTNRAIPKQININIQNLMNVDSIDLTKGENVAIIERVKREVAYALYEAAADGTMMLNDLATS
jgi:TP901 family phage tail tape measure protein